jgi:hypothetical protein
MNSSGCASKAQTMMYQDEAWKKKIERVVFDRAAQDPATPFLPPQPDTDGAGSSCSDRPCLRRRRIRDPHAVLVLSVHPSLASSHGLHKEIDSGRAAPSSASDHQPTPWSSWSSTTTSSVRRSPRRPALRWQPSRPAPAAPPRRSSSPARATPPRRPAPAAPPRSAVAAPPRRVPQN